MTDRTPSLSSDSPQAHAGTVTDDLLGLATSCGEGQTLVPDEALESWMNGFGLDQVVSDELKALRADPWDRFWRTGEVDTFRWEFCKRFLPLLAADPRTVRLRDLLQKCDFEPHNGFFAIEVSEEGEPLDFMPHEIRTLLSDVVKKGDPSQGKIVLTADERSLALETYAVFTELATHYLTEFAPTQSDLVAPLTFLTPTRLAAVLLAPLKDAMKFAWDGTTVTDFK